MALNPEVRLLFASWRNEHVFAFCPNFFLCHTTCTIQTQYLWDCTISQLNLCVFFSVAFCKKKQTKKHYLLLRSLSQRCQIEAWLEGRLKETPTGEGKNKNQTYPSSLFWCFLIKFFGDCLIGKKSSHLGVGRESESRPSWPLCKRILPAESGLESLLWSDGEKVKVKIKLATKLWYWQIQTLYRFDQAGNLQFQAVILVNRYFSD